MGTLYETIMSLCEEKGISGYRLCKDIGMQPSVLTDLKMGRQSGLSAQNADRVASYFGVSVGYLLGSETKKEPATQTGSGLQWTRYDLLNEKNKAIVDSLIETLLASQSDS